MKPSNQVTINVPSPAHPWAGNLAANLPKQQVTPTEWKTMVASSGQPYFGLASDESDGERNKVSGKAGR